MSKKKSFSGSTMTLKDFHGGSIPSELPLPSAPGLSARQPDRIGPDRSTPSAWGRPDSHRPSRPGSAGGIHSFDEVSPFLHTTARLGLHFDEDERKPFDASSAPRRLPASNLDSSRPALVPQIYTRPTTSPSPPTRLPVSEPSGVAMQPTPGPGSPNAWAWGPRREVVPEPQPQVVSSVSASRFAQASALETISSGRWQSKPLPGFGRAADAEVLSFSEVDGGGNGGLSSHMTVVRNSVAGDELDERYTGVVNGQVVYGTQKSTGNSEIKEKSSGRELCHDQDSPQEYCDEGSKAPRQAGRFAGQQVKHLEGRFGELHVGQKGYSGGLVLGEAEEQLALLGGSQQAEKFVVAYSEVSETERPKLKLLPRTRPLENSVVQNADSKKGLQSQHAEFVASEGVKEGYISSRLLSSGPAGADGANETIERPKLHLKRRSQVIGHSDVSTDRERQSLFGGARPRELVLKERGLEVDPNNSPSLPDSRTKLELTKVVNKHVPTGLRDHEQKDYSVDVTKSDTQRGIRGNENWRNLKEYEKPVDRQLEPERWRKPIEEPEPVIAGPHIGKIASALELAQAFSRSASASTSNGMRSDSHIPSNQKAASARNQVLFSRLTDNRESYHGTAGRRINGY